MAIDKDPVVEERHPCRRSWSHDLRAARGLSRVFDRPPGLPYDPAKRAEAAGRGWISRRADFPRLSSCFRRQSAAITNVAQIVRRQWQQELGIEVDLESMEVTVLGARLHSHDFSIAAGDWYGDYDDISTFTDLFKSTSENNNPDWKRPGIR